MCGWSVRWWSDIGLFPPQSEQSKSSLLISNDSNSAASHGSQLYLMLYGAEKILFSCEELTKMKASISPSLVLVHLKKKKKKKQQQQQQRIAKIMFTITHDRKELITNWQTMWICETDFLLQGFGFYLQIYKSISVCVCIHLLVYLVKVHLSNWHRIYSYF